MPALARRLTAAAAAAVAVAGYVGRAKGSQVIAVGSRTQLVPVGVKPGEALPTSFTTVRGVVYAGKVDGPDAVGIVTRARLPYRIFVVTGPGSHNRIVVDVAHRW
ncbi:hypothetical protein GGG17_04635 [Arsenicicoccus sp. MKL-02]|uniref:AMIN-like domain-containing protein n=1 Tax=Arsenicicoccus cauae TaxID=2663847 RepID=A0A6I3IRG2_9MICO|nr:hypothetical protein [Arsenicicoccus cauae]MTB71269.1 hypothetical protein [Arsenicicoccus cauae]